MNKKYLLTILITASVSSLATFLVISYHSQQNIVSDAVCNRIHQARVVNIDDAIPQVQKFGEWRRQISTINGEGPLFDSTTCAVRFNWETMRLAFGVNAPGGLHIKRTHVRAYMALDSDDRLKLYFVPVTGSGWAAPDGSFTCGENNYVLNLTTPCPKTCGTHEGVLKQAFTTGWNEGSPFSCTQPVKKK